MQSLLVTPVAHSLEVITPELIGINKKIVGIRGYGPG